MRKVLLSYIWFLFAAVCLRGQEIPVYKILKHSDRVFYNTNMPKIEVKAYSGYYMPSQAELTCNIRGMDDSLIYSFTQEFRIDTEDSAKISFAFNLEPGFYKVRLAHGNMELNSCNIGYEPEKIEYTPTGSGDIYARWEADRSMLSAVPLDAQMTKIKKAGGKESEIYALTLRGLNNRVIKGYYSVPKKKGVYGAVITFYPKDSVAMPAAEGADSLIRLNIAPDSSSVDLLRAVDFLQTRTEVSLKDVVAQGEGKGASYALIAAALDVRIWMIAIHSPVVRNISLTDIGSLNDIACAAGKIRVPVLFGMNLDDDGASPALENFMIYNNIKAEKNYYIFIGKEHGELWRDIVETFYTKYGND